MTDQDAARARVRPLPLSGDDILKNRDDDTRWARACERYSKARQAAEEACLEDSLPIIDIRLHDVTGGTS